MTFGDILVHMDGSEAALKRLRFAMEVAAFDSAHVTGCFVRVPPQPAADVAVFSAAGVRSKIYSDELGLLVEIEEREQRDAEAAFRALTASRVERATWLCIAGDSIDAIAPTAIFSDLVIIGDDPLAGEIRSGNRFFAGELALRCGRPVLTAPARASLENVGSRILIAWNGRREAARAVSDALPFLERARFVTVLHIQEPWQDVKAGVGELENLIVHLAHFGVAAERYVVQAPEFQFGDQILAHARRTDCNLIVMGAYGHSRIGEVIIGGVTRTLLKHTDVPLLLSH
jgi:nucleotide-binding universal stress UspA family protein